ncbi:MAG: peptide chain release factor N(5)-glutamine methyltransferase [Candidatus Omnitrophica bacterium]|nr:peptide chain release factor N(5)-glutamine methyltransferase [Candidatus Omnitrophota bacterium]
MLLQDWLNDNKSVFAERDLRFLLKNTISESASSLTQETYLDTNRLHYLEEIKKLYVQGKPMAYILEKEEFYGYSFAVNCHTLIPRPETEIIVERAIEIINKENLKCVLDLCCGCANIAISIRKQVARKLLVVASDISLKALMVSKMNISDNGAEVSLINANLFSPFKKGAFDIIITNPPYVEKEFLEKNRQLSYEPRLALFGGMDGLDFIRKIIYSSHHYLRAGGYVLIEVGQKQKNAIEALLDKMNAYEHGQWIIDYGGNFRGVILKKKCYS